MKFRREIERKFIVDNYGSYRLLNNYVHSLLSVKRVERGTSRDTFWKHEGVDFIRLRENTRELTVKVTDRGDIVDRMEENLIVPSYEAGYVWASAVWGEAAGSFVKEYTVYYSQDAVVSVYHIVGDQQERMFLEVEGDTIQQVNKVSSYLEDCISLSQEYRSLYSIFFEQAVNHTRKVH